MEAKLKFFRKNGPTVFENLEIVVSGKQDTLEKIIKAVRLSAETQGFKEE